MIRMTQEELNCRLYLHQIWIIDPAKGERLVLRNRDMGWLNFLQADLRMADLSECCASGANFMLCKFPPVEMLPDMQLSDTWGSDFYGGDDKSEKEFFAQQLSLSEVNNG